MYDVQQDHWTIVTNTPIKRENPAAAALNNKIYVSGGSDENYYDVSSVECFDPDTNTWSQVKNMNIARSGHSLVSLYGRLYAIGGYLVGKDSVEVYDPDTNTWTLLQNKLDGEVHSVAAGLILKSF